MKIVIASDSFKGSASSMEVARAVERGVKQVFPHASVVKIPVADGGEGTVDALVSGGGAEIFRREVEGPLGARVSAAFAIMPNRTAIIEMAAASGLPLVPKEHLNPLLASTYGTGELIRCAIEEGCKKIVLGIGGSATNDGGVGMAQALGVSFLDEDGREVARGGGALSRLAKIDMTGLDPRVAQTPIVIASDVTNPLFGETGASKIFAPQKGATAEMAALLDVNLERLARVHRDQTGADWAHTPGAGAAGGLGFGLMAFCGAEMRAGIEIVLDLLDFDARLQGCDLVITGEGRIDGQSAYGKVPVGVARRAKRFGVPVLAIAGSIGEGAASTYEHGIDSIASILGSIMPLEQAMKDVLALLEDTAARSMRAIDIGMRIQRNAP